MVVVFMQLERLDEGRPIPRLSGPYGIFFHQYAEQRSGLVELAIAKGLADVRRDGAISCAPIGSMSMVPMFPDDDSPPADTQFGKVVTRTYACPQLFTTLTLRLWLSA